MFIHSPPYSQLRQPNIDGDPEQRQAEDDSGRNIRVDHRKLSLLPRHRLWLEGKTAALCHQYQLGKLNRSVLSRPRKCKLLMPAKRMHLHFIFPLKTRLLNY